jgi:hypothetical protein
MRLLKVTRDGRTLWLAALAGEDIYTYVPNTAKFHRNAGLRDDYFMERELQYDDIGVAEARELLDDGLPELDEERMADPLREWRADPEALDPETVFAAVSADLA